jgi:hypothetical protein
MAERVVSFDLGVRWDPNTEHGVLVVAEDGDARLHLDPDLRDADSRRVVIAWSRCSAARMEPPNDEAISGHRLYEVGLKDVLRVGEVLDSSLMAELEIRNRVHPRHDRDAYLNGLRHWVVRLKGSVVEVVAEACKVSREITPAASA